MAGLTLLNIDRESSASSDPLSEIRDTISEIEDFIRQIDPDAIAARLVPLKMKLSRLLDVVGQFGTDETIPVNTKQSYIMELHPDLQMLSNQLYEYGGKYSVQVNIAMNFLLNHLCSTAASDPRSTVIGVSNVMAQVLSNDIQIVEIPVFDLSPEDPKFFEEFARIYNSMLTTAGLFAAPILGLPDIPISALGGWADQALEQFSNINRFVAEHYDPQVFYQIDKNERAVPFDTTTDILSFYVYENEFLAALISRADLLSGLEFPRGFTGTEEPITLQSTDEITELLANSIVKNSEAILAHMNRIMEMFQSRIIDRNEKPENHPHLMEFEIEAKIWTKIAELAKIMMEVFRESKEMEPVIDMDLKLHHSRGEEIPPLDKNPSSNLVVQLHETLIDLNTYIFQMFPEAKDKTEIFIESSGFTRFREYLVYILHIVSAHDVLLRSRQAWTPWLLNTMRPFLSGAAYQYNPQGALQLGVLTITLGVMTNTRILIDEGKTILMSVREHLEFHVHHLLAIDILLRLVDVYHYEPDKVANAIMEVVMKFLNKYQINPESMLYQRANLYLAMLSMFQSQGEFLRKENERYVAFDAFSYLQLPKNSQITFPYMPLNTSIDNLNSN